MHISNSPQERKSAVRQHIETERLNLRDWKPEDLNPLVAINQDKQVLQYLPGPLTPKETKEMIDKAKNHIHQKGYGRFSCEEKKTGTCIGYIGLGPADVNDQPYTEIGWRLSAQHWGKGYATEGAKAILHKGFTAYGLEEIISFTVRDNMRSRRVMEKIGLIQDKDGDFQHSRLPKDHPLSWHVLYRLTKQQYLNAKGLM